MKYYILLISFFPLMLSGQDHVGINTNSPVFTLDVRGTDDVTDGGEFQIATPSQSNFIRLFGGRQGDKNPFLAFSDTDTFHFVTTAPDWSTYTRRMSILGNGNIGIGVETPNAQLHISANSTIPYPQLRLTEEGDDFARIKMESSSNPGALWDIAGKADTITGHALLNFYFKNGTTAGDRMTITGIGNVGIGNTNPTAHLHIGNASNVHRTLKIVAGGTTNARIDLQEAGDSGLFLEYRGAENRLDISGRELGTDNATPAMSVTRFGHVGIHNPTPVEKLDVNGRIKLGDDISAPTAGTMRWNSSTVDFEGYNGTEWLSLTNAPRPWGESFNVNTESDSLDGPYSSVVATSGNFIVAQRTFLNPDLTVSGEVDLFEFNGSSWIKIANFKPSPSTSVGYGSAIELNGSYLIVGSPKFNLVYIYTRNIITGVWSFSTTLIPPETATDFFFGTSVSMSGDIIAVGAPQYGSEFFSTTITGNGKVYTYQLSSGTWSHQQTIVPADGEFGGAFGQSLDIDGDYLVVGSPRKTISGIARRGKAYVYHQTSSWALQANLAAPGGMINDCLGNGVSIEGEHLVLSQPGGCDLAALPAGKIYGYNRSGTSWTNSAEFNLPENPTMRPWISLENGTLGAIGNGVPGSPVSELSKAYLYERDGNSYSLKSTVISSTCTNLYGLELSGTTLVCGGEGLFIYNK